MSAVLIFMLIYYRGAGINADVALILNLVILLGFLGFSRRHANFTGIAGVILTVGMGVDSNVLIFERIREELRNGKTPPSAVDKDSAMPGSPSSIPRHHYRVGGHSVFVRYRPGARICDDADLWSVGKLVHGGICLARDFRLGLSRKRAAKRLAFR